MNVPTEAVEVAAAENVMVAMPPDERVTSVGNVNVTPVATVPVQEADNPIDEANPLREESVRLVLPVDP